MPGLVELEERELQWKENSLEIVIVKPQQTRKWKQQAMQETEEEVEEEEVKFKLPVVKNGQVHKVLEISSVKEIQV